MKNPTVALPVQVRPITRHRLVLLIPLAQTSKHCGERFCLGHLGRPFRPERLKFHRLNQLMIRKLANLCHTNPVLRLSHGINEEPDSGIASPGAPNNAPPTCPANPISADVKALRRAFLSWAPW